MQKLNIAIPQQVTAEEIVTILEGSIKASPRIEQLLLVTVRDEDGKMIGGLVGSTYQENFEIKSIWVAESSREGDLERQILEEAEREACRRGCKLVLVENYNDEQVELYQRLGYGVWDCMSSLPGLQEINFMYKSLTQDNRDFHSDFVNRRGA